jgi:hypothetical protein
LARRSGRARLFDDLSDGEKELRRECRLELRVLGSAEAPQVNEKFDEDDLRQRGASNDRLKVFWKLIEEPLSNVFSRVDLGMAREEPVAKSKWLGVGFESFAWPQRSGVEDDRVRVV